jgi:hypothetical protein
VLAVCVVLVLSTARADSAPELKRLRGHTSKGFPIELTVLDGRLDSFDTRASVWCPEHRVWRDWKWSPSDGLPVKFRRNGSRFHVRERVEYADENPRQVLTSAIRGTLGEDGNSARGAIQALWIWGHNVCRATVRFSAD